MVNQLNDGKKNIVIVNCGSVLSNVGPRFIKLWVTNKCRYHVPRSWLKPTDNSLVLFEELGGDPTRISLVKRSTTTICGDMFEYHPNIKDWHIESYGKTQELHRPKVHLHCGPGLTISAIKFASFGTPMGTCGTFQQGTCHAPASYDVIEKVIYLYLMHK